jgi:hypothetical protein
MGLCVWGCGIHASCLGCLVLVMSGDDDQLSCTRIFVAFWGHSQGVQFSCEGCWGLAYHICIAAAQFTTAWVCDLLQLGMCTATMKHVLVCYMRTQVLDTSAHASSAVLLT